MRLTNYGGATAAIEHAGKRMLFDPWLDDGIFHGAWFHYPPVDIRPDEMGRFDYVYISHIHEDHCSAGTIKYINRDAEIILMDRKPNFVLNFLNANGFKFKKIHLIKARTPTEIGSGIVVDMIEADPEHELNHIIDSALMMKWGGFTIYNANDCKPYPGGLEYIKRVYGHIDLALVPYTGGSGYPACYLNLSHEEKIREKNCIFDDGIESFIDTVKELRPMHVMPFADQYLIAGTRSHLNQYMAHPASPGAVIPATEAAGLTDRLLLLNSGQSFDLETKQKIRPNHSISTQIRTATSISSHSARNVMTTRRSR